jgi:hypothetical protein
LHLLNEEEEQDNWKPQLMSSVNIQHLTAFMYVFMHRYIYLVNSMAKFDFVRSPGI